MNARVAGSQGYSNLRYRSLWNRVARRIILTPIFSLTITKLQLRGGDFYHVLPWVKEEMVFYIWAGRFYFGPDPSPIKGRHRTPINYSDSWSRLFVFGIYSPGSARHWSLELSLALASVSLSACHFVWFLLPQSSLPQDAENHTCLPHQGVTRLKWWKRLKYFLILRWKTLGYIFKRGIYLIIIHSYLNSSSIKNNLSHCN